MDHLSKQPSNGHNIELSRPAASAQHQQFIQTQPLTPIDILGDGSNDMLATQLSEAQVRVDKEQITSCS